MAYLDDHPPVRDQWFAKRNRPLTGATVLHTSESILDTVGPDTGAEAVADFIRRRTTPGSYHDLVDSDSWVQLVDYSRGAFHDGTGSNNWALSISFACRTSDWRTMSPEKRRGFLRQGARAFAAQQAYRRRIGAPPTELRLISKAQSDRGESGFTYHGLRDPGRRSDPGVASPNLFPIDEFIAACRAELAGTSQEDDMPLTDADVNRIATAVWTRTAVAGGAHAIHMLHGIDGKTGTLNLLPQIAAKQGISTADLAAALTPVIRDAVKAGMAADNAQTADEIVDELVERLQGGDLPPAA